MKRTGNGTTRNHALLAWVEQMATLCGPEAIHWCDGSAAEAAALSEQMVQAGTFIRLNEAKRPNSFLCRSDPRDVARVEGRTFICSNNPDDAGPNNNWSPPGR
ncbi:MAG: hypothetical protein R3F43_06295 [bacterium]